MRIAGDSKEVHSSRRCRLVLDSGAGIHITPVISYIHNLRPLSKPIFVTGAFGKPVVATLAGEGKIPIGPHILHVDMLVYNAEIGDTLLSYVLLTKDGHKVTVEGSTGKFTEKDDKFSIPLSGEGNILSFLQDISDSKVQEYVPVLPVTRSATNLSHQQNTAPQSKKPKIQSRQERPTSHQPVQSEIAVSIPVNDSKIPSKLTLIHARYGHLGIRKLEQLARTGLIKLHQHSSSISGHHIKRTYCEQTCEACRLGKATRLKFSDFIEHRAKQPNDKVVGDVCGPIWVSHEENGTCTKWYLSTVTDVYSRHLEIFLISSKDQASDHVIDYFHRSKILTGKDMRHFHTDGGREYNKAEKVLEMRGTKVTRTGTDTPQHNAIAERKNRTIMEMARSLVIHAQLPVKKYWRSAIETAVFIHNRCTIVGEYGKTMHELFTGQIPHLTHLRVFGCDAFVVNQKPESKLAPRSVKGVFIGYDRKRELCYRIKVGEEIIVSRDVVFHEESFTVHQNRLGVDQELVMFQYQQKDWSTELINGDRARAKIQRQSPSGESVTVDLGGEERKEEIDRPTSTSGIAISTRRARESASAKNHKNKELDTGESQEELPYTTSEMISDSDREINVDEQLDLRTRKKLESAMIRERREQQGQSADTRHSSRVTKRVQQTGVNLEDFGQSAFKVTPILQTGYEMDVSSSDPSNQTIMQDINSSTAEHAPGTIPPVNTIRVSHVNIPGTRRAALRTPEQHYWIAAMDSEYKSIIGHDTYQLVSQPSHLENLVSCKWVFSVKDKDGFVVRFKARLVARGFTQRQGIDYEETYSPVLKYKTLRIILALVAAYGYHLELMDVQTAYLHAELKETVYMQQPEGYEQYTNTTNVHGHVVYGQQVCLLKKALYGLKQAGREWNLHLDNFVQSLGFRRCEGDTCVYVKMSESGRPIILSVYVDDIPSAYAPEDAAEWVRLKDVFFGQFKIAFQPEADWVLNMRITRDETGQSLLLDQQAYVETMLEDLQMHECKPSARPGAQEELSMTAQSTAEPDEEMKETISLSSETNFPYRRVIGLLMYLANTSRPDISHSVSTVSRYVESPKPMHVRAVKQILRYLSGTSDYGLVFNGMQAFESITQPTSTSPLRLLAYADADWAGCKDTRRSTTGWILLMGNSIIDWGCKKQQTVALSSCEAEYMAVCAATQAILWTRKMLTELGIQNNIALTGTTADRVSKISTATPILFSDNRAAIAMATNDVHHNRSKHIDIRHHFIRDEVANGNIILRWIPSHEQIADALTKNLGTTLFTRLRERLVESRHGLTL